MAKPLSCVRMKGHRLSGWGPREHGPGGACPRRALLTSLVGGYCVGTIVLFTQGCTDNHAPFIKRGSRGSQRPCAWPKFWDWLGV